MPSNQLWFCTNEDLKEQINDYYGTPDTQHYHEDYVSWSWLCTHTKCTSLALAKKLSNIVKYDCMITSSWNHSLQRYEKMRKRQFERHMLCVKKNWKVFVSHFFYMQYYISLVINNSHSQNRHALDRKWRDSW